MPFQYHRANSFLVIVDFLIKGIITEAVISSGFNLLFNLVPLISLYRQIPIGKTSLFIEKKPIFK